MTLWCRYLPSKLCATQTLRKLNETICSQLSDGARREIILHLCMLWEHQEATKDDLTRDNKGAPVLLILVLLANTVLHKVTNKMWEHIKSSGSAPVQQWKS